METDGQILGYVKHETGGANNRKAELTDQFACRLCGSTSCRRRLDGWNRELIECSECSLIFVPRRYHLGADKERRRYALHNNSMHDAGYLKYLRGFRRELLAVPISKPSVLDFGSGRECVLTRLLRDEGLWAHAYDPLYDIGKDALQRRYDLVVMCEVIEHLRNLRDELALVRRCCVDGGYVVIRTETYTDVTDFGSWWYAADPTHINFFHPKTMSVVAQFLQMKIRGGNRRNIFVLG
ncbi:MAG: methyltransferase domain-containing protein [Chitinivibrionales bacterium]|nr:methyltransferase domain-containing protein [Chitinivibrionales bacterium]MBD3357414.1 methyltransferase domain-containing protein [Chitinivibrionales bacterium]